MMMSLGKQSKQNQSKRKNNKYDMPEPEQFAKLREES